MEQCLFKQVLKQKSGSIRKIESCPLSRDQTGEIRQSFWSMYVHVCTHLHREPLPFGYMVIWSRKGQRVIICLPIHNKGIRACTGSAAPAWGWEVTRGSPDRAWWGGNPQWGGLFSWFSELHVLTPFQDLQTSYMMKCYLF